MSGGPTWNASYNRSALLDAGERLGMALLYMCASPLILAVILSRAIVRTVGEVVGYAVGAAPAAEARMGDYELNKLRYTATPLTAATIGR